MGNLSHGPARLWRMPHSVRSCVGEGVADQGQVRSANIASGIISQYFEMWKPFDQYMSDEVKEWFLIKRDWMVGKIHLEHLNSLWQMYGLL